MSYVQRAKDEFSTIAQITMGARGYVSAKDIMQCCVISAVKLAFTGQCSALTVLFQEAQMIGPKVRSKDGKKELYTLTADGKQVYHYITDIAGLGLGAIDDFCTPVVRFDRELGTWKMGSSVKKDPSWKSALGARELSVIDDVMNEMRWDKFGMVAKVVVKDFDVNDQLESVMKRARKASRDGKTVAMDNAKLAEQLAHLQDLVKLLQADQQARTLNLLANAAKLRQMEIDETMEMAEAA